MKIIASDRMKPGVTYEDRALSGPRSGQRVALMEGRHRAGELRAC
jgi:hypothetical protein